MSKPFSARKNFEWFITGTLQGFVRELVRAARQRVVRREGNRLAVTDRRYSQIGTLSGAGPDFKN
jgi:hypothetical protein